MDAFLAPFGISLFLLILLGVVFYAAMHSTTTLPTLDDSPIDKDDS